jgi:hypothetical protein
MKTLSSKSVHTLNGSWCLLSEAILLLIWTLSTYTYDLIITRIRSYGSIAEDGERKAMWFGEDKSRCSTRRRGDSAITNTCISRHESFPTFHHIAYMIDALTSEYIRLFQERWPGETPDTLNARELSAEMTSNWLRPRWSSNTTSTPCGASSLPLTAVLDPIR